MPDVEAKTVETSTIETKAENVEALASALPEAPREIMAHSSVRTQKNTTKELATLDAEIQRLQKRKAALEATDKKKRRA